MAASAINFATREASFLNRMGLPWLSFALVQVQLSTPKGLTCKIPSATFCGEIPPARITGMRLLSTSRAATDQSQVKPVIPTKPSTGCSASRFSRPTMPQPARTDVRLGKAGAAQHYATAANGCVERMIGNVEVQTGCGRVDLCRACLFKPVTPVLQHEYAEVCVVMDQGMIGEVIRRADGIWSFQQRR